MTADLTAKAESLSTVRDSYRKPNISGVREVGRRHEQLRQELFEKVRLVWISWDESVGTTNLLGISCDTQAFMQFIGFSDLRF